MGLGLVPASGWAAGPTADPAPAASAGLAPAPTAAPAVAGALPASAAHPAVGGLSTRDAARAWPSWQVRGLPSLHDRLPAGTVDARPGSGGLLGSGIVADVYLSPSGLGPRVEGGFRATSGLFAAPTGSGNGLNLRSLEASAPLPYLGVGYGGWIAGSGLSVQADLGLMASSGAVRLGRSLQSAPAVDELVRDLRLAPVLRLGISYAF